MKVWIPNLVKSWVSAWKYRKVFGVSKQKIPEFEKEKKMPHSICHNQPECCGAMVFNVEGNVVDCPDCRRVINKITFVLSGQNPAVALCGSESILWNLFGILPNEIQL